MKSWSFIGNFYGECSVNLIAKHWALTSGHCCVGNAFKSVQFGSASLFGEGGVQRVVSKIFLHPEFNSDTFANDICLILLKEDLEYRNGGNEKIVMKFIIVCIFDWVRTSCLQTICHKEF